MNPVSVHYATPILRPASVRTHSVTATMFGAAAAPADNPSPQKRTWLQKMGGWFRKLWKGFNRLLRRVVDFFRPAPQIKDNRSKSELHDLSVVRGQLKDKDIDNALKGLRSLSPVSQLELVDDLLGACRGNLHARELFGFFSQDKKCSRSVQASIFLKAFDDQYNRPDEAWSAAFALEYFNQLYPENRTPVFQAAAKFIADKQSKPMAEDLMGVFDQIPEGERLESFKAFFEIQDSDLQSLFMNKLSLLPKGERITAFLSAAGQAVDDSAGEALMNHIPKIPKESRAVAILVGLEGGQWTCERASDYISSRYLPNDKLSYVIKVGLLHDNLKVQAFTIRQAIKEDQETYQTLCRQLIEQSPNRADLEKYLKALDDNDLNQWLASWS